MASKSLKNWISSNQTSKLLEVDRSVVPRICAAAAVRTRQLPSTRVAYYRPDVERVVRESVIIAGEPATASA